MRGARNLRIRKLPQGLLSIHNHWQQFRRSGHTRCANFGEVALFFPTTLLSFLHYTSVVMGMDPTLRQPTSAELFLQFSRTKLLDQFWLRLQSAIEPLDDEQIWWRPNAASNSIGNLLLHLNGNVWQWIVGSFNRLEDARNRPAEFNAPAQSPKAMLLERLQSTMQEAEKVLYRLTETKLLESFKIQGYTVRGLDAVYQVVEHFGMHYGQILYIAKMLEGRDLGFYKELSRTGRHGN